jgi:hypothetical protein
MVWRLTQFEGIGAILSLVTRARAYAISIDNDVAFRAWPHCVALLETVSYIGNSLLVHNLDS